LPPSQAKPTSIYEVPEGDFIFVLCFTAYIYAINITMPLTSALKRLCGYRSAVILVLGFWLLIAALWMTVRISLSIPYDCRLQDLDF
jgi:hypothetical protein